MALPALAVVALGNAACGVSSGGGLQPTAPTTELTRSPVDRPAISSGRAGQPTMAFDPGLYVDREGYHLFYTAIFCRRGSAYSFSWDPARPQDCNITVTMASIGYAFSPDNGLTWEFRQTPVIVPGDSGFDASKIETAFPFRRGDTLYLAYSAEGVRGGRPFAARYQIGLAALGVGRQSLREVMMDESRRFVRRPTPLLSHDLRPGRFDSNVQEPSITTGPQGMVLYYTALGFRLPDAPINAPGQQITSLGLGRAELDSALNVTSRSEASLLAGINITEVRYFDGAFHLFGTISGGGGEFHRGERLAYSHSIDGLAWDPPRVMLEGGVPGFDNWGVMAPTVAVERDRLVLFYTAFGTEPHACFPVPADGRFGRPTQGGQCMFATVGRAVMRRPIAPGTGPR